MPCDAGRSTRHASLRAVKIADAARFTPWRASVAGPGVGDLDADVCDVALRGRLDLDVRALQPGPEKAPSIQGWLLHSGHSITWFVKRVVTWFTSLAAGYPASVDDAVVAPRAGDGRRCGGGAFTVAHLVGRGLPAMVLLAARRCGPMRIPRRCTGTPQSGSAPPRTSLVAQIRGSVD